MPLKAYTTSGVTSHQHVAAPPPPPPPTHFPPHPPHPQKGQNWAKIVKK